MESKKIQRNSSIELLRIIATIGVIVLHYNGSTMGQGLKYVNSGTIQEKYLLFSESIFTCAVNLFVMISAYFLSTTQKRKFIKVIELIGQVIVFQTAYYLVSVLLGHQEVSFKGIVCAVLPANYFVILYLVVYLVSPYINVMIKNISKKDFTRLVVMLFFLFSVCTITVDVLIWAFGEKIKALNPVGPGGDEAGYTIVNFVLVYFIGAYIRLNGIKIKKKRSAVGIIICSALIYLCSLYSSFAWIYNNPIVILLPVFLILFFSKLNFESRVINELAKANFTCYLFHVYLMTKLGIEKFVNGNVFVLILHQLGSAIAIYLVSYLVYKIYNMFTKPIIKWATPKCDKINISL